MEPEHTSRINRVIPLNKEQNWRFHLDLAFQGLSLVSQCFCRYDQSPVFVIPCEATPDFGCASNTPENFDPQNMYMTSLFRVLSSVYNAPYINGRLMFSKYIYMTYRYAFPMAASLFHISAETFLFSPHKPKAFASVAVQNLIKILFFPIWYLKRMSSSIEYGINCSSSAERSHSWALRKWSPCLCNPLAGITETHPSYMGTGAA